MRARISFGKPAGKIAAPPSKSMAHRAILAAALANGESRIAPAAYSEDILATLAAVSHLGAKVTRKDDEIIIRGIGDFSAYGGEAVDCRESGSTLRFLIPLFSLTGKEVTFTGKGKLLLRPQTVYEELFLSRGGLFSAGPEKIRVKGALTPGHYEISGGVSSQFITGLLFALPLLKGDSVLRILPPFESGSYVDLTIEALSAFGIGIEARGEDTFFIPGPQTYTPRAYRVEGDYSQAAFFAVLGAAGGSLAITGLKENSAQGDRVILDILTSCGAKVTPVRDGVQVEGGKLSAFSADLADCPDLGPILMVLGALCEGTTVLTNAGRLRLKESDRIGAMEEELKKFGVDIGVSGDEVRIRGGFRRAAGPLWGHRDHRVVMSLAVLAALCENGAEIEGAEAVNKSYPDFFEALREAGIGVNLFDQ